MDEATGSIGAEDVEALARKLAGLPGLDDHDRLVLSAVFARARVARAPDEEAEVSGFSAGCNCPVDPSGRRVKVSPTCPFHAARAGGVW